MCGALGDCGVGHASVPECAAAVWWPMPAALPCYCWRLCGAVCLCEVHVLPQHCSICSNFRQPFLSAIYSGCLLLGLQPLALLPLTRHHPHV